MGTRLFSCHWGYFAHYLGAINVDIRLKSNERESVNIKNCNCRQQMGEKFGGDKARRYKKKVDRGDGDISGVYCNFKDQ